MKRIPTAVDDTPRRIQGRVGASLLSAARAAGAPAAAIQAWLRAMERVRIEYGGCSVRNRANPRRSAVHCASTMSEAGKVDAPMARTLPARMRSVSTDKVSSMSVSGDGR